MRVAVIDLGTNTFNLLLAHFSEKVYEVEKNLKFPVNLGRGGINEGYITPEAMLRGYEALSRFAELSKGYAPDRQMAFATSAIRNARNGEEFVREVKARIGIDIQVIDGQKEAELIYHGVHLSGALGEETSMIMDIGGGSTEFIIGHREAIYWKQSFELGAARLLDLFKLSDPITQDEIFQVEEYLTARLTELDDAVEKYRPTILIGSSGSFDTLAEMISNRFYDPDLLDHKTSWEFKLDDYYSIHEHIIRSTKTERLRTKGMMEMRVDMIVVATLFVNYIIRKYHIQRMRLSTYSLKEGVLYQMLKGNY